MSYEEATCTTPSVSAAVTEPLIHTEHGISCDPCSTPQTWLSTLKENNHIRQTENR